MTAHDPPDRPGDVVRGRALTFVSGFGAVIALVAIVVLALRGADDGGPGTVALPGLPAGAMTVGLQDDQLAVIPTEDIAARVDRLAASGAKVARVDVLWSDVAPRRPGNPRDPNDPAYLWARTDAILDALAAKGITPIVDVFRTPGWANGDKGPEWAPAVDDYGDFVAALASRYVGGAHPAVRLYEPWNEPNNPAMLMPQWEGTGVGARPAAPGLYASLVARADREVKAANPGAAIVGLSLADVESSSVGVGATGVVDFVDALAPLKPPMDATAVHLLPGTPPGSTSTRIPSFGALPRMLAEFDKVAPGVDLLVTQVGYPTPAGGLTEADQATYVTQTMATLARNSRVRLGVWYTLQDTIERPSGLLRASGEEKPSWAAFVANPKSLPSATP